MYAAEIVYLRKISIKSSIDHRIDHKIKLFLKLIKTLRENAVSKENNMVLYELWSNL